ncbi:MAG: hypothetical protein LBR85_02685 [Oscillospiraceae bacterium]|jgi:N-acetylglucosamine kinase-like BadF-type ATPase|nr:hypothetical protein [Oscillospiraceae bacterium]
MSKLIMGVDGGGTKSHLALFDADGNCVGVSACGPLNHECLENSYDELEERLGEFILGALRGANAGVNDVAHALFGLAGVDTKVQHALISGMLRKIGLPSFTLCNDAFLGIAAGCPDGTGICAINGTGSAMAGVDGHGAFIQVGGIGELSNDCGGSGWYGTQTLGAVYGELFKRERPTALRPMLFELIGVTRPEDYTETVTLAANNGSLDRNALNRLVFAAAHSGDAVAQDILKTSAAHYAGGIVYLAETLDFPSERTLYVALAGSVFVREKVKCLPRLIEWLVKDALKGRKVEFVNLETVPVAGAVLWASKIAGTTLDMSVIRPALERAGL